MKKILAAVVLTALTLFGCTEKTALEQSINENSEKPVIAVSIIPQKAFVEAVCKDRFTVIAAIPPGSSPESYEMSPIDTMKLQKAKIYYSIGVPAEKGSILKALNEDIKIVNLENAVSLKYDDLKLGDERDPHIWLSPKRVVTMIEEIEKTLSEEFPEYKEEFSENAKNYKETIVNTSAKIEEELKDKKDKTYISVHPAFNYFADEYGLNILSLEKEGKKATPIILREMIDIARENGVKTVFSQQEVDTKQAQAFAKEIGGKVIVLNPLSHDYIENLMAMKDACLE